MRIPDSAKNDTDVIRIKRIYTLIMIAATVLVLAGGAWLYFIRPAGALLLSLYQPTVLLIFQYAVFIPLWKKSSRIIKNLSLRWTISFVIKLFLF